MMQRFGGRHQHIPLSMHGDKMGNQPLLNSSLHLHCSQHVRRSAHTLVELEDPDMHYLKIFDQYYPIITCCDDSIVQGQEGLGLLPCVSMHLLL
jgi:hypothetical protein